MALVAVCNEFPLALVEVLITLLQRWTRCSHLGRCGLRRMWLRRDLLCSTMLLHRPRAIRCCRWHRRINPLIYTRTRFGPGGHALTGCRIQEMMGSQGVMTVEEIANVHRAANGTLREHVSPAGVAGPHVDGVADTVPGGSDAVRLKFRNRMDLLHSVGVQGLTRKHSAPL